ncbi:MAG: hypothetical protein Q8R92_07345, partial [Deltaproteobacteria bacterium]|nr:hypothetical protein [Deltaproteobacteria bacterium]
LRDFQAVFMVDDAGETSRTALGDESAWPGAAAAVLTFAPRSIQSGGLIQRADSEGQSSRPIQRGEG